MTEQISFDGALINLDVVFGHIESDQRYVQTGPDSVEFQSRSRHYDRSGSLIKTTEWEALSIACNVPEEFMKSMVGSAYVPPVAAPRASWWKRLWAA